MLFLWRDDRSSGVRVRELLGDEKPEKGSKRREASPDARGTEAAFSQSGKVGSYRGTVDRRDAGRPAPVPDGGVEVGLVRQYRILLVRSGRAQRRNEGLDGVVKLWIHSFRIGRPSRVLNSIIQLSYGSLGRMTNLDESRRRRFRLIAVLLVPGILAAAELALQTRSYLKEKDVVTVVWTDPDPWLGYRLRRDFRDPSGTAYVNASGFRGDTAHLAGAPGDPRILLLGNSCVFGAGVRDTEVFAVHLERLLRESGRETAIVWNGGVGGYNSRQCLFYLERELWALRPTHLVVYVGWNDVVLATWPFYVANAQLGEKVRGRLNATGRFIDFCQYSKVFWTCQSYWRFVANRLFRSDGGKDVWNGQCVRDYGENIAAIVASARDHGVPVYLCLLPYDPARAPVAYSRDGFRYTPAGFHSLWSAFMDQVRAAAADSGATVVDLPAALAGLESAPGTFVDYNHLGPSGHEAVAMEIFGVLR